MDEEEESPFLDAIDFVKFLGKGTGSKDFSKERKVIDYRFNQYIIKVELTQSNEFIGISGVTINADFRSFKQKMISQEFHDIEDFFTEE